MKTKSFAHILKYLLILLFVVHLEMTAYLPCARAGGAQQVVIQDDHVSRNVLSIRDDNGVRVVFNDVELFFNASNGGEITEYFDLAIDPSRSRNLVNLGWKPFYNLRPLFASLFYHPPPYTGRVLSTGGDPSVVIRVIANTSQYVIMQTSSRIMSRSGEIAKDVHGNTIRINSTWIIRDNNLVSVERTFDVQSYAVIPFGWRWYPFHFMRTLGFGYNATYYMFNTTYGYSWIVNDETYENNYETFAVFPNDANYVFGVAAPFSNSSIEGDGGHNILLVYKYDELINVTEWRSDNFQKSSKNVTEFGAVHEFSGSTKIPAHTYHMLINFTHQPIDEQNVQDFARHYVDNLAEPYVLQTNVATDKSTYAHGDSFVIYGLGVSHYDLANITGRLVIEDDRGGTVFTRYYGPRNLTEGQTFNATLFSGTVSPESQAGNYTIAFQLSSSAGILIASDSTSVELI